MPDRTQDLKNHRQVAVACKNYTDSEIKKSEGRILSIVARNNVNYIDHIDEASYKITAPANAKLLMLQSIGGNTVKLSPSVASDSTKAMIKTMPSTVYTFDGSKFYGDSEVSENLAVFDDVAETTINGVKVKYQDGAVYLDGTANAQFKVVVQFKQPIYANKDYYVKLFTSGTTTATNPKAIGETSTDVRLLIPSTTTFNVAYNINYFWFSAGNGTVWTNYVVKPMIVKGTTEPTEWKQGFSDIHNIELTGIRSEGANKAQAPSWTGGYHTTTGGYLGSYLNGIRNTTKMYLQPSTQYTISYKMNLGNSTLTRNLVFVCQYANDGTFIERTSATIVQANVNGLNVVNFTSSANVGYVEFSNYVESVSGTYTALFDGAITEFMLNEGSTALPYEAYVSTTKTIDLSSILYNGNPLFDGNSLKGVGTAKDYITPYVAHKQMGRVKLKDLNYTYVTDGTYPIFVSSSIGDTKVYENNTPINAIIDNQYDIVNSLGGTPFKEIATNKIMTIRAYQRDIMFRDDSYTDATTFKNHFGDDDYFYFELATPIEVSIDWSAILCNIQGYPNGSIIAENTHNMDVESVITYNSIIQETLCPSVTVEGANKANNPTITNNVTTDYTHFIALENLNLPAGTYTISFHNVNTLNSGTRYYITADPGISYIYTGANSSKTDYSLTFTTTAITTKLYVRLQYTSSGNTGITTNVMLNEGSTALDYRPYKASITRNLPTQASDGWSAGTQRNYRVFCDDEGNEVLKRGTNVNKSDLGNYNYGYNSTYEAFFNTTVGFKTYTNNLMCLDYSYSLQDMSNLNDMTFSRTGGGVNNALWFKDERYNNTTIFKNANVGNPLYYELADTSKTETDMDDFDYFFDVEEGDVITFNNPYAQQVYATYSFLIKEAKSNE